MSRFSVLTVNGGPEVMVTDNTISNNDAEWSVNYQWTDNNQQIRSFSSYPIIQLSGQVTFKHNTIVDNTVSIPDTTDNQPWQPSPAQIQPASLVKLYNTVRFNENNLSDNDFPYYLMVVSPIIIVLGFYQKSVVTTQRFI